MLIDTILKDKGNLVQTISDTATWAEAANVLDQKRIGAIVAVDGSGDLIGVLSERDIVRRFARNGEKTVSMTVSQAMTRGVITASPSEDVDTCLGLPISWRLCFLVFFFFKQKTAYEMCGRDWSSDVCSSDLWFNLTMKLKNHMSKLKLRNSNLNERILNLESVMAFLLR